MVLFTLVALLGAKRNMAQELMCSVEIDTRQIQASDKQIYETLRVSIYEFLNNRTWTNYDFEINEKIECSMLLTIEERISPTEFKGTLSLALRRPVYNSTYNTVLMNYIDRDIHFNYIENEPLDFNPTAYMSNLTSILGFYAYLFIGLDFDSFNREGGQPYFEAAQEVVNAAQNANFQGWKSYENQRNRYWLVENLLNRSYNQVRDFFYEFHRTGLDLMYENPDQGRKNILKAMSYLQKVKQSRPGLPILQIISDAKREEIINVFSKGTLQEKTQALAIMKDVDPAHSSDYQKITE